MFLFHLAVLLLGAQATCSGGELEDWAENDLKFTSCVDGFVYGYTNLTKGECDSYSDQSWGDSNVCWWDTTYESRCLTSVCVWEVDHWQGEDLTEAGACYCKEYNLAENNGNECPSCTGVTPAPTFSQALSVCTDDCFIWKTGCGSEICHCNRANELCAPTCVDPVINEAGCLVWAPTPHPTPDPTQAPVSAPTFQPTVGVYWSVSTCCLTESQLTGGNGVVSQGLRLFALDHPNTLNDNNNRVKLINYKSTGVVNGRRREDSQSWEADYMILLDNESDATDMINFIPTTGRGAVEGELGASTLETLYLGLDPPGTGQPTSTPTVATPNPTANPTASPVPDPTPRPTANPTAQPTAEPVEPTPDPTASPVAPTPNPTSKPSSSQDTTTGGDPGEQVNDGGGGSVGIIIGVLAALIVFGVAGLLYFKTEWRLKFCPCCPCGKAQVRKEPDWDMATTKDFEKGREMDKIQRKSTFGRTNTGTAGEQELPTQKNAPGFVTSNTTPGAYNQTNAGSGPIPGMPAPPPVPTGPAAGPNKPGMGPRGTSMDALRQPVYVDEQMESGGEGEGETAGRDGRGISVVEVD